MGYVTNNGTYVEDDGTTTKKTLYSCKQKGLQYTTIGDDIKSDFDFLLKTGSIAQNLDSMLKELNIASSNTSAFLFENGSSVNSIDEAYQEIETEVEKLKDLLQTLHDAFITDIDNVNAELEVNFGHWIGTKATAGRTVVTENK